ncbi:hypothetical protein TKK_0000151 [Trichogramma kaykai]
MSISTKNTNKPNQNFVPGNQFFKSIGPKNFISEELHNVEENIQQNDTENYNFELQSSAYTNQVEFNEENYENFFQNEDSGVEIVDINNIGTAPELPHIITSNPHLKILIDSGASSSVMNPKIAFKLFSKIVFPYNSKVTAMHKKTKGTHAFEFHFTLRSFEIILYL